MEQRENKKKTQVGHGGNFSDSWLKRHPKGEVKDKKEKEKEKNRNRRRRKTRNGESSRWR